MNNTMAIKIERGYQSVEQARDIAAQKLRAAGYAVDAFGSSVYVNGFREEDGSLTMFNEAEAKEVIELFSDNKAAQYSHRPVCIDVVFDPEAPIEEPIMGCTITDEDAAALFGSTEPKQDEEPEEPENLVSRKEIADIAAMTDAQVTIRLQKLKPAPRKPHPMDEFLVEKQIPVIERLSGLSFTEDDLSTCISSDVKLEYIFMLAAKRLDEEIAEQERAKDPMRGYKPFADDTPWAL